jgi:hypothetical protein
VATSITEVYALGMSMYGDLLDNDVCRRNVENAAIRGGLSHGNCFCNAGKFSKQSKGFQSTQKVYALNDA